MTPSRLVLTLALAVLPPALSAQSRPDSLTLARRYTVWFYTAQFDSLIAHHPADVRKDSTLRARFEQRLADLAERAGTETEVVEEKFVRRNKQAQYWRTAKFSGFPEPILFRWVINPDGEILGMGMGPLSQAPPIDPPQ